MTRRLLVSVALLMLLGGPTPGAVGNCGEESAPFADLRQYCRDREALSCERQRLRGEIAGDAFQLCLEDVGDTCNNRFWAPGCRPTTRQVNACIAALQSYDTLAVEEDDLPECKIDALCTVNTISDGGAP